jgi:hypothetical protein
MSIGTTSKQQQSVADTQTNWSQTVTFAQFDPAQEAGARCGRCVRTLQAMSRAVPVTGPCALHRRCADPGEAPDQWHVDRAGRDGRRQLLSCRTAAAFGADRGEPAGRVVSRHRRPLQLRQRRWADRAVSGLRVPRLDAAGCASLVVTGTELEAARRWLRGSAAAIRRAG